MTGPIQQIDAEVMYAEHQRQMARINEHDWKYETATRHSLRAVVARMLLALAQRIAPPAPATEHSMDALAQ
jgi:hypothetical protein